MLTHRPQPRLTGGTDHPEPRCGNYRDVIDALDTKYPDPELVEAVAHMCATCPLQPRCHDTHAHEQWLVNVQRFTPAAFPSTTEGWAKRQQARIDELEAAAQLGLGVTEVTDMLGTTYNALREWCRKHGQRHLWAAIKAAA